MNGYVTAVDLNTEGTVLGITSWSSVGGIPETKITLIRLGAVITADSVRSESIRGEIGSASGFITDDRYATVLSDRLMIWTTDASVAGEVSFEGKAPVQATLGEGRVAVLLHGESDLAQSTLRVFERNGREIYSLLIDADHPVQKSGGVRSMRFGGNALFLQTTDRLFRLSPTGDSLTSAEISRDVLAILPQSADEVLVCTPAYATRVEKGDFTR